MNDPRNPGHGDAPPAPRRTRSGQVIIGPTVGARYRPGALIGLPLVSALLSPFAGAGLQQWRASRLQAGHDGLPEQLLAPAWTQLLLGALLLWALFALWALVPLLLTQRTVLLDEGEGTIALRKGPRIVERAPLAQVEHAVGEAERGGMALIGVSTQDPEAPPRQWIVPEVGWDGASFDGLRALQAATGLRPAPPREVLRQENRRRRRIERQRELAARLGMPWRAQYEDDEEAFQAEFDRVRRVLGGREPAREGDPER